jgi:hypothetical protein
MQSVLGGCGANFDPSFQGLAVQVGGTNDNVHSEISGSSGGILAYTETPISDGWRIRYYSAWDWADGPATIGYSQMDLQGVACHEYGHALGLGHSSSSYATMYASALQGAVTARSVTSDDRAGIQSIYGVLDGQKPLITGVQVVGNQITVQGANFDSTGNQLWFTQAGNGGAGTPIKVTGLSSANGQLSATIPAAAGPGDVLVRRNGTTHRDLSNAWPSLLQEDPPACLPPTAYCTSAPNSVGAGAQIGYAGSASLAANDLVLSVSGCPGSKPGLFFYGPDQVSLPSGDGLRCVGGATTRLAVLATDPQGAGNLALDLQSPPFTSGTGVVFSGDTRNFQFWYRDSVASAAGFNFSNGLSVTFCP